MIVFIVYGVINMKKLFAYFIAFLMSLKSATEFDMVEDKTYKGSGYMVEEQPAPDYRDFYYGAHGEKASELCNLNLFSSDGKQFSPTLSGYWFVDGETPPSNLDDIKQSVKDCELTLKKMFTKGTYIIAPGPCKLKSYSAANDGTIMVVDCTMGKSDYKLTINNMECWYCDVDRSTKVHNHTGKEQHGKDFKGGQVLGRATEKTTIAIKPIVPKDDKTLKKKGGTKAWCNTIEQFYKGKWGINKDDKKS